MGKKKKDVSHRLIDAMKEAGQILRGEMPPAKVHNSCGCVWKDLRLPCKTQGCKICSKA